MNKENADSTTSETYIRLGVLKSFICEVCQEKFYSKIHYQVHSITHMLPEHFNCDECQEGLTHFLNFNKHLATHKNHMLCMICHVCKKEFFDIVSLNEHVENHSSEFTYTWIKQQDTVNKTITSKEQNTFRCDKSNKKISNIVSLNELVKKRNSESANALTELELQDTVNKKITTKEQNPFRCDKCNKGFSEKHHLDKHYQSDCIDKQLKSSAYEKLESVSVISENDDVLSDHEKFLISDAFDVTEDAVSSENCQITEVVKLFTSKTQEQLNEKTDVSTKKPVSNKQIVCEVCQKTFLSKHSLAIHFSTHSGNKKFKCHLCEKNFTLKCLLNAHLQAHKINKFSCGVCNKIFTTKDKLFKHVHIHALVKTFSCNVCEMTFSEKSLLTKHNLTHPTKKARKKKVTCEVDQKVLSCKSALDDHMPVHTGLRSFTCETCSKTFASRKNLLRHHLIHTGEKPFQCETCGAGFNRKDTLTYHQQVHQRKEAGTASEPCSLCPEGEILKSSEISRDCIHMENRPFKCDGLPSFTCETCSKTFTTRKNLLRHHLIHTGEKPFQCETCGASFNRKDALTYHQQVHQQKEARTASEPCSLCPEGQILKSYGNSQDCIHMENRPFKCEICDRGFKTKNSLTHHQYIHSGQTPYVCEICNKGFRRKHLLKLHKHSHSGVKPFLCEACGKNFATPSALRLHSYSHLEQKRFVCEVCQKGFGNKSFLDRHVVVHTGERPYACDLCDKKFTQRPHLNCHLRNVHGEEKRTNSM